MQLYDIFLSNVHPRWIQSILARFNKNILVYLLTFFKKNRRLSVLEIGPGKGYFYRATRAVPRIRYSAFDRNSHMLKQLNISRIFHGEAPTLVNFKQKFHIIYIAYVIEHLQHGEAIYELIRNCKKYLYPDGIIVMLAPNALAQGLDFWNEDYTHLYPTTKRNVAMAFYDNGISDLTVADFNDAALWMTSKGSLWMWIVTLCQILFYFYNYHVAISLLSPLYHKKEYELDNILYRLYLFLKAKNLLFVARYHRPTAGSS
ncbi:methyltransferase domain-containing protein [Candidatus Gottesmanbacteria bacterium]|nr:methyltransferase domain-containing protein [Candidatus Gottesmanbacteria bacterium]